MMKPDEIKAWSAEFREGSQGEFQINLWIPEAPPKRDSECEKRQREFLAMWGPPVPQEAGDAMLPDFEGQCQTIVLVHMISDTRLSFVEISSARGTRAG